MAPRSVPKFLVSSLDQWRINYSDIFNTLHGVCSEPNTLMHTGPLIIPEPAEFWSDYLQDIDSDWFGAEESTFSNKNK